MKRIFFIFIFLTYILHGCESGKLEKSTLIKTIIDWNQPKNELYPFAVSFKIITPYKYPSYTVWPFRNDNYFKFDKYYFNDLLTASEIKEIDGKKYSGNKIYGINDNQKELLLEIFCRREDMHGKDIILYIKTKIKFELDIINFNKGILEDSTKKTKLPVPFIINKPGIYHLRCFIRPSRKLKVSGGC